MKETTEDGQKVLEILFEHLEPGTTYQVRTRASNIHGEAPPSKAASIKTVAADQSTKISVVVTGKSSKINSI